MPSHIPFVILLGCFLLPNLRAQTVPPVNDCSDPVNCDLAVDYFPRKLALAHMTTILDVTYSNTYVDLTVDAPDYGTQFHYRFLRCGCPVPEPATSAALIQIPPASIFVDSSPVLAMLTSELALASRITAIATADYVVAPVIHDRIALGLVAQTGDLAGLVNESVIPQATRPTLAIVDTYYAVIGFPSNFSVLTRDEVAYFANGDSSEQTPLGRAEYIKIYGLLFNQLAAAENIFQDIVQGYEDAKTAAFTATRRPSVLTNEIFFGSWFTTDGNSYAMQLLRDANADYRLSTETSGRGLNSSEVEELFGSAFYWINSPVHTTVRELVEGDPTDGKVYKDLESVQCGNVWHNAKVRPPSGLGTDYFESGAVRPDRVLRDLVQLLHPNVYANSTRELFYYAQLAPDASLACPRNELPATPPADEYFTTVEYRVDGANRFLLEDNHPAITDSLSTNSNVPSSNLELFFERHNETGNYAILQTRYMTSQSAAASLLAAVPAMTAGLQDLLTNAVAPDATVKLNSEPVSGAPPQEEGSSGLSSGAIAGICIGVIAGVAMIVAGVNYWSYQRGLKAGLEGYETPGVGKGEA